MYLPDISILSSRLSCWNYSYFFLALTVDWYVPHHGWHISQVSLSTAHQSLMPAKKIICCAAICLFLINTPILFPWIAPASPLFLLPSLFMHIHLYDYLNGCQKNTVTRLIWAVRERRKKNKKGGEGPCDSPHSLLVSGELEGERETVAMATCWQLLSLRLKSTGCSVSTQRLRGEWRGRRWGRAGWGFGGKRGEVGGVLQPRGTTQGPSTTNPESWRLGK